jgi:hypothetical protein
MRRLAIDERPKEHEEPNAVNKAATRLSKDRWDAGNMILVACFHIEEGSAEFVSSVVSPDTSNSLAGKLKVPLTRLHQRTDSEADALLCLM